MDCRELKPVHIFRGESVHDGDKWTESSVTKTTQTVCVAELEISSHIDAIVIVRVSAAE
jgi:hypothetical protein